MHCETYLRRWVSHLLKQDCKSSHSWALDSIVRQRTVNGPSTDYQQIINRLSTDMFNISQNTLVQPEDLALLQAQRAAHVEDWARVIQWLQRSLPHLIQQASAVHLPDAPQAASFVQEWLRLLLEVLVSGEFQDRWEIAKLCAKLASEDAFNPAEITAALMDWLQDSEAEFELRWFAARILGEFRTPAVLESLIRLMQTAPQPELVETTAIALSGFGTMAIAPLTALLEQEQTRLLAVKTLAQIRNTATLVPLLQVVQDPDSTIRAIAIEALGSFHDARVPPVLIEGLRDRSSQVRRAAVVGLSFRADLLPTYDLVSLLQPLLWDIDDSVCVQTAIALGRLGNDAAATALSEVLCAPFTPNDLRLEVIRALGWIQSPLALQGLCQFFSLSLDQNPVSPRVYQEALVALGRLESPALQQTALKFLVNLLQSHHPAIEPTANKQAIALTLGQLGHRAAIDPLIELLADANPGVRFHAIAALQQIDAHLAHQKLAAIAQASNYPATLKAGVAIALQEWRQP